jgi:hypothetical protein
MLTRVVTKLRRFIFVRPQLSDGLAGEIRSCKDRDRTEDTESN